jgi:hypothetical protein
MATIARPTRLSRVTCDRDLGVSRTAWVHGHRLSPCSLVFSVGRYPTCTKFLSVGTEREMIAHRSPNIGTSGFRGDGGSRTPHQTQPGLATALRESPRGFFAASLGWVAQGRKTGPGGPRESGASHAGHPEVLGWAVDAMALPRPRLWMFRPFKNLNTRAQGCARGGRERPHE